MKVLITGITGFAGSHLADYILSLNENIKIYGTCRWRSNRENIEHLLGKITLFECDLKDASSVKSVIDSIKPDRIFHLAAQSFVSASWNLASETIKNNIIGNLNLLEAVRHAGISPRIQIACSSEEYGMVKEEELPITEKNELRPLSPYAVSKVGQDLLSYQYFQSYGIDVVRTRAFNHTGPRRGHVFVASDFAKQIAEIEAGKREPVIYVGNLKARRDFTDVRDVVKAYWLALEKCKSGDVYNICSGKDCSMDELLHMLLAESRVDVEVKQDPAKMRPSDVLVLRGDYSKFEAETGWKPQIPFKKTLQDILNYWRSKIN
ncbi:MAG: SDR family oxidoreductase [Candidatus Schekmanbacteria bacterium]|nr:MAG: SDR family oxidoreductase [Candidatus Schekmanbacteria bacterium]